MLNRPLFAVAGALVLVFVGMPVARGSSRLSEMAARQDLHDLVCIAASDGHLSGLHRAMLLEHARNILPLQEYRSFKQALNRIPPPGKSAQAWAAQSQKPRQPHAVQQMSAQRRPAADQRAHAADSAQLTAPKKPSPKHAAKPNEYARANQGAGFPPASRSRDGHTTKPTKKRSSGVRNIAPPPKRPGEPAPLPELPAEPKPVAEPDGPTLVVPVTALLPDRMASSRAAR